MNRLCVEALPWFFGRVFSCDLGSFLPDVSRSVGVLQLVDVNFQSHGVGRWEVFTEAGAER